MLQRGVDDWFVARACLGVTLGRRSGRDRCRFDRQDAGDCSIDHRQSDPDGQISKQREGSRAANRHNARRERIRSGAGRRLGVRPADYSALLEALESGVADVVFGSRFVSGRPHRVLYFWHSLGNRFLALFSNAFTDLNLTDMETDCKMSRREIIQSIDIRENRFGFRPEITAKVAGLRCRVYEVGISYTGRAYDEDKKIGWRDGLWAIVCIVRYSPLWNRRGSSPIDRRELG